MTFGPQQHLRRAANQGFCRAPDVYSLFSTPRLDASDCLGKIGALLDPTKASFVRDVVEERERNPFSSVSLIQADMMVSFLLVLSRNQSGMSDRLL